MYVFEVTYFTTSQFPGINTFLYTFPRLGWNMHVHSALKGKKNFSFFIKTRGEGEKGTNQVSLEHGTVHKRRYITILMQCSHINVLRESHSFSFSCPFILFSSPSPSNEMNVVKKCTSLSFTISSGVSLLHPVLYYSLLLGFCSIPFSMNMEISFLQGVDWREGTKGK